MSWLTLGLLGGVVGLDATSFPQTMLSRPLVAGTLAGLALGRPAEGMMVGLVLEVFSLGILPIGAARYPESGTAAVAATGAYLVVAPAGPDAVALLLALGLGLAWEPVAGLSVVLLRRESGRRLTGRGTLGAVELERLHLGAMTRDFVRGGIVTVTGAMVGSVLLALARSAWGLPGPSTIAALSVLVIVMLGTGVSVFGTGRRTAIALAAGAAVGVLLTMVTP